ncbi:MAG: DUF1631 family protein [Burkholderiales bacterium]|nr:DUF1631 family protein [Burkholderiales bacterium]
MSKDLRTLFANSKPQRAGAGTMQRRAGSRKVLEAGWAPAWTVLQNRVPTLVEEAVVALAREAVDEALVRSAKKLIGREQKLLERFEQELRNVLKQALDDFVSQRGEAKPKAQLGSLSLVDYGAMDMATLVEAAAARALNAVDDDYTSVKLRIANLVRDPEIKEADSPFRPALFFRALHESVTALKVFSDEELVQVLPFFDRPMTQVLIDIYKELDGYLKKQGYAADIARPTVWRSATRGRLARAGGLIGSGISTRSGDGDDVSVLGPRAEQVLQALYQRLNLGTPVFPVPGNGAMPLPDAANIPGAPPMGSGALPAVPVMPPLAQMLFGGGMPLGGGFMGGGYIGGGSVGGLPAGGEAIVAPPGEGGGGGVAGATPLFVGGGHAVVSVDLLNAINEIHKLGAMALSAVQHGQPAPDASIDNNELRSKLVEKAPEQVDKLTIEIVGLLFERINRDKHVPAPIKELLQRLQFPMIKVALTDPELFVSPDQAARTLIDRIASTSIGWTNEGEENQRFLAEVRKAVHTVLSSEDSGLAPFEQALEAFELYLLEERTRDDDPVARAKRALADAENREVMAINATIQIRTLFDGLQIESYLREFLLETWVRVMVAHQLRNKDDPKAMRRFLVIVPDLVWSVQPKLNPEERKRLVNTIPPVLSILREGLALIEWPKERMQEFFGRLMNSHAEAVKALELAHGQPLPAGDQAPADKVIRSRMVSLVLDLSNEAAPATEEPVRIDDDIVKHVIAAKHADVNHLSMPESTEVGDSVPTVIEMITDEELDEVIRSFKRGDWFNLRFGGVTERVRLRWISPRHSLYLFTPADGRRAHSVGPDALRAYLRRRELLPVEAEPLFERLIRGVAVELQQPAVPA